MKRVNSFTWSMEPMGRSRITRARVLSRAAPPATRCCSSRAPHYDTKLHLTLQPARELLHRCLPAARSLVRHGLLLVIKPSIPLLVVLLPTVETSVIVPPCNLHSPSIIIFLFFIKIVIKTNVKKMVKNMKKD